MRTRDPLTVTYVVLGFLGLVLLVLGLLSKVGIFTFGNGPAEISVGIFLLIVAAIIYFFFGVRRGGPRGPVV